MSEFWNGKVTEGLAASRKPKKKPVKSRRTAGSNLVVILTMPLQLSREYTIGELTDIFEAGAKALIKTVPGAKLNRAPDVGLEVDKAWDLVHRRGEGL